MLPTAERDLILAGAILSIVLNPLIFAAVDWLSRRLEAAPGHRELMFSAPTQRQHRYRAREIIRSA